MCELQYEKHIMISDHYRVRHLLGGTHLLIPRIESAHGTVPTAASESRERPVPAGSTTSSHETQAIIAAIKSTAENHMSGASCGSHPSLFRLANGERSRVPAEQKIHSTVQNQDTMRRRYSSVHSSPTALRRYSAVGDMRDS